MAINVEIRKSYLPNVATYLPVFETEAIFSLFICLLETDCNVSFEMVPYNSSELYWFSLFVEVSDNFLWTSHFRNYVNEFY